MSCTPTYLRKQGTPQGSSNDYTFTVNNSGGFTATAMTGSGLAVPFSFKGGAYPGTAGTCGPTLAAGANCTIVVTFAPVALGAANSTIHVDYNDGSVAQSATRPVTGTGVPPGVLSISDGPTFDFGIQATTSNTDHTFTVTNTGGFMVSTILGSGLAAPFDFAGGSYPGAGGTCGANLAPAASCTIVVRFSPVATGPFNDTIQLDYNNGFANVNATRDVVGTGANPALLAIDSGPTYDYGTLATGATAAHAFTVSNTGGVPATGIAESALAAPFAFLGGAFPGTGGTCTATLIQGSTCTLVVRFAPTLTGLQNGTIQLDYNNGAGAVSSPRAVQGTGAGPALVTISNTDPYDYGTLANGSFADHTFTLTNTGGVAATALGGSGAQVAATGETDIAVPLQQPQARLGGRHVPQPGGVLGCGPVVDQDQLARQRLGLVHAHDGHRAFLAGAIHVEHGRAEEHLVAVGLQARIDHFGDVQALGQKAHAAVDFAQAFLAVEIIAVLGPVAVGRGPGHDLHHRRPLHVHQVRQFVAQLGIALRRHVVARTRGQRLCFGDAVLVVVVGLFDECLVHIVGKFRCIRTNRARPASSPAAAWAACPDRRGCRARCESRSRARPAGRSAVPGPHICGRLRDYGCR